MFVRFEYNGRQSVAEVPDFELFRKLSWHLCANAEMRSQNEDAGYSKVWIELRDGEWIVDLP